MDGTAVIASMIFLCVGILTVMVFSEPLKVIGRILLGAVLGMVGIYDVPVCKYRNKFVDSGCNGHFGSAGICGSDSCGTCFVMTVKLDKKLRLLYNEF